MAEDLYSKYEKYVIWFTDLCHEPFEDHKVVLYSVVVVGLRPAADPINLKHLLSVHVVSETAVVIGTDGKSLPKNMYAFFCCFVHCTVPAIVITLVTMCRYSGIEFKAHVPATTTKPETTTMVKLLFLKRPELSNWLMAAKSLIQIERNRQEEERLLTLEKEVTTAFLLACLHCSAAPDSIRCS